MIRRQQTNEPCADQTTTCRLAVTEEDEAQSSDEHIKPQAKTSNEEMTDTKVQIMGLTTGGERVCFPIMKQPVEFPFGLR